MYFNMKHTLLCGYTENVVMICGNVIGKYALDVKQVTAGLLRQSVLLNIIIGKTPTLRFFEAFSERNHCVNNDFHLSGTASV